MFYIYVIQNEEGKIYIGQTSDIEKRLARHNGVLPSKSGSYTRVNKGVWKVVYKEEYTNRLEVLKREKYLKSHVGRDWLKTVMVR